MSNSAFKSEYIRNLNPERKIQVRMNNDTYNINGSTTFSDIPINGLKDRVETGFKEDGDGWIALFDGWVDAFCRLPMTSDTERVNCEIVFAINGSPRPVKGAEGYIRNADDHSTSSISVNDGFAILRGQKITVQTRQEASSGSVLVPLGSGIMKLKSRPVLNYGSGPSGVYLESFETSFGSWSTSNTIPNSSLWRRLSGATPSDGTGPTIASDGSFYVYCELSDDDDDDVDSQSDFYLSTSNFRDLMTVSFDYHMFGADVGALELQYQNGVQDWTTVWNAVGDLGDVWNSTSVDLSALIVTEIRFKYGGASDWRGDCALDKIRIESE